MARYGCLVVSVILALVILFGVVWLWSGWLNRPRNLPPAYGAAIAAESLARRPPACYNGAVGSAPAWCNGNASVSKTENVGSIPAAGANFLIIPIEYPQRATASVARFAFPSP